MKKRVVILFLLVVSSFFLKANTIIDGVTFKPYKGKTVNLIQYTDYITKEYDVIATTTVDSLGKFYFDVDLKETQEAIIQIEYLIGIIYLDPNQKYTIYFPPISEDGTYKLTKNNVNIVFINIQERDINGLILEYDRYFDQFLMENRYKTGLPIFHTNLDTFKIKVTTMFKNINNKFFTNYMKYSIANLELISPLAYQKANMISIYNRYIINRKINYQHPTQIRFLLNFYEKSLKKQMGKTGRLINEALTTKPSYKTLDESLKNDYFFKMKSIREFVIIENLYTIYYDNEHYDPNTIIDLIRKGGLVSGNPEIHNISQNILDKLSRNKPGTKAYPFELKDKNGDLISLESLKGKYVYINFWAVWNKQSQAEMDIFRKLKADYGSFVEFVSINMDSKKKKFDLYIASHPQYDWTMLYYGGNSNLLNQYEIYNIPHYLLIDTEGNIVASPANRPSPNGDYLSIDKTFFELNKQYTKKKTFNIGTK